MPREMFGDVVKPSIRVGTKQWYTVPLSILTHSLGLAAMIVIPLLATDALPTPQSVMAFAAVVAYANPSWMSWSRAWAGASSWLLCVGIGLTQSRQALVGLILAIVILAVRKSA